LHRLPVLCYFHTSLPHGHCPCAAARWRP
jgi:hypothetical protein